MSTNANYPPRDRSTSPRIGVAFWRQKRGANSPTAQGLGGFSGAPMGGLKGAPPGRKGHPLNGNRASAAFLIRKVVSL